jgi:hypothetical protein
MTVGRVKDDDARVLELGFRTEKLSEVHGPFQLVRFHSIVEGDGLERPVAGQQRDC